MLLDNAFLSDNRVEREAISLIAAGYSVEVVCLKGAGLPENEQRNSIRITRLIDPLLYTRPFSGAARSSVRGLIEMLGRREFDYLHVHDYNVVHVGKALKQARSTLPALYDSHEYFAEFPFYRNAKPLNVRLKTHLVWRLLLLRERWAARSYDALIATTDYISERLSRRFRIPRSISLRNIPERQEPPSSNHLRASLGLEDDAVVVAHLGNIYFQPDYLRTIHRGMAALHEHAYFVMLVDPSRSIQHRAFVAENAMADRVRFVEYPPKEKSIEYLSSASIGFSWINPEFKSSVYTSANRYWEYTMARLPVVGNHQIEAAEEIRKFGNGLIYSEEGNGLSRALLSVLRDYKVYKAAAIRASQGSSWESESKKLVELYEALGRPRGEAFGDVLDGGSH